MALPGEVWVIEGARTPFGTFGGALRDVSATELGVVAAKAALERSHVDPASVDNVVFGNVIQTSKDSIYLARHVGLRAGVPVPTPALTVNRLCGSGLQALALGAQSIALGEASVALVGGSENMSQAPHVVRGARWGLALGQAPMEDSLWEALIDTQCGCGMAETAENLAARDRIPRTAQDEYALRSHRAAVAARSSGILSREIVPVEVGTSRGQKVVQDDEHIREDASLESMARLRPRFSAEGTVTAANASGINDGAAALVLASADAARRLGLRPIGRLVSSAVVGVDPQFMGIGPVPASRKALERASLTLDEMDVIEVNEAFAAQYLAVEKALGLDRERTNVNGGAIALGHPLGASGARLALTLLYELRRRGGRYGLAALCIGGGQGIAAVFEALG